MKKKHLKMLDNLVHNYAKSGIYSPKQISGIVRVTARRWGNPHPILLKAVNDYLSSRNLPPIPGNPLDPA